MNARLGLIVVAVAVALYFLFKSQPAAGSTVFTGSTAQPVGIGTNGGVAGLEAGIQGLGLLLSGQSLAGPGQSASAAASLSTGIQQETQYSAQDSDYSIGAALGKFSLPAAPVIANPTTAPSLAGIIGSSGTSIPNLPAPTNAVVTPDNGTTTSLFSLGDSGDDDPAFDAYTLGGGNSFLSSNVYS